MKTKFSGILTLILALVVQFSFAQEKTISGTVSDETGLPLPGTTVLVKGTSSGTSSDFDGKYSIKANQGDVLVFSFVGYTSQEISVSSNNTINVTMNEDAASLEEVVIIGYGTKKKGELASAVSTITSAQLAKANNTVSIDNALQGTTTGVQVVAQNGKPGNAAFVRVRGVGSINAGNEPLYLLDGIVVDEEDVIGINPSDIESMSVLKDAASTAIYGARGSNGVVLINTKSGRTNTNATFRLHTKTGFANEIKRNFRVMNAREKLEYERAIDVGVGSRITSETEWNELLANDHDWTDDLFKEGKLRSINFSVSGGEEKMSYFMSIANDKDTGIIEGIEEAFERTSARLNITYEAREWLTLSTKLGFSTSQDQDPRDRNNVQSSVVGRFTFNPYEPVYLFDDEGNFIPNRRGLPTYNPTHTGLNSLAQVRANEDNDTDNRWFGTFNADIKLHENIRYSFVANGSYLQTINRGLLHAGSDLDILFYGAPNGDTNVFNTQRFTFTILNKLTYDKVFAEKHHITATAFTEFTKSEYADTFTRGQGFTVNGPTVIDVAATPNDVDGFISANALFSVAGSFDYVYDDKYILNGTIRRDGSSRFGIDTKYGVFWAGSAAWNVHNESFFNNNTVSTLKLRLSAGTSGNDQVGLYDHLTTYGFGSYNSQTTSFPSQFGDPNLGWEESFTLGAGLEFGLFNDRITGVFDYYKRTTSNLLLNVPKSYFYSNPTVTSNIGEIENSGFEMELRGQIFQGEGFNWSLGALFSLYDNEVTKLENEEDLFTASNFYTGLRVGEEVHTFYLPRYVGVNPANGQALFLDTDDNVTTSNNGGEVFLSGKSPFAKFDGGLNSSMSYKGFELTADFYFRGGNYIFNTVEQQLLSDGTGAVGNQRVDAWNFWKQPGDTNVLPDPTSNNPFRNEASGNSDRYLQKGDYIRLRNVQFGYTLPSKFLENTPLSSIRMYVSGTNLWTYTPYYKGDPEVGIPSGETTGTRAGVIPGEFSLNSYPTLSSIMFGVDIKF
ncbi:SusC/RagA family TonB-linked outer membrane protein [Seonamhaeicola maritimus]|uniref:SusC/RagA family TonB-linked outer membrane protein n=1 Tax=Seonamhaeicola maritimus TaxID=2591822 RepID=UPI0024959719|nr:SusC/RagA family TonB-linked outer membrane protein [Seonamhaeicola maritimus]